MSADIRAPAARPCGSCPYRRDVPAGIWDSSEYEKLPRYDQQTWAQPQGVFMCHQQDGRPCAGWLGCHDPYELMAVRLVAHTLAPAVLDAMLDYTTDVPLFDSGQEAADHGLSGVSDPDVRARRQIDRLNRKREVTYGRDPDVLPAE